MLLVGAVGCVHEGGHCRVRPYRRWAGLGAEAGRRGASDGWVELIATLKWSEG